MFNRWCLARYWGKKLQYTGFVFVFLSFFSFWGDFVGGSSFLFLVLFIFPVLFRFAIFAFIALFMFFLSFFFFTTVVFDYLLCFYLLDTCGETNLLHSFFFSACRFKGRDVKDLVTRIQQTVATVVGLNWNRTWARMACDLRGCSLAAPPSPPPSIPRSAVSQTRKCNSCHACVTATSSLCSHACQETDKVDYCFAQSFLPPPIVVVFWDSFFKNQNPSFVPRNFVNSWSNSPDLLMT